MDNTLKVWDLATGVAVHTLSGHTKQINAMALTPDGRLVISASNDHTLKVWDVATGDLRWTLTGHTDSVNAVAETPDGQRAVSASMDNTLKVWDLATGVAVHTLSGHTEQINAMALTPDGRLVISSSNDHTLKVWDVATGAEICTLEGHTPRVLQVGVTADGQRVFTLSGSNWETSYSTNTFRVWVLTTGMQVCTLIGPPVNAVGPTRDGRWVVIIFGKDVCTIRDPATDDALRTLPSRRYGCAAITRDGFRAISISGGSVGGDRLTIWDLGSGLTVASFSGDSTVNCFAVAPDNLTIVVAEATGRVHFLRLKGLEKAHDSR
jgi:WD40 repeat protein